MRRFKVRTKGSDGLWVQIFVSVGTTLEELKSKIVQKISKVAEIKSVATVVLFPEDVIIADDSDVDILPNNSELEVE